MQMDRPDGSASPTRPRADRGWSLDLTASGRLAASLAAVLVAAAIAPVAALASGYDPADDANSMYNTTAYPEPRRGGTPATPVRRRRRPHRHGSVGPGSRTRSKIIYGPDLSLESQSPELKNLDTNGHGTFMAGLIAGKNGDLTSHMRTPRRRLPRHAPDARIVSVKVGVADGARTSARSSPRSTGSSSTRRQRPEHPVINLSSVRTARRPPRSTRSRTPPSRPEGRHLRRRRRRQQWLPEPQSQAPALANPAMDRYLMAVGSSTRWNHPVEDDRCRRSRPASADPRSVNLVAPCTSSCASRTASST